MTVKELRDKLATLPDDMEVVHQYDGMWHTRHTWMPKATNLGLYVVTLWDSGDGEYQDRNHRSVYDKTTNLAIVAFDDDARYVGEHPCREVTT